MWDQALAEEDPHQRPTVGTGSRSGKTNKGKVRQDGKTSKGPMPNPNGRPQETPLRMGSIFIAIASERDGMSPDWAVFIAKHEGDMN